MTDTAAPAPAARQFSLGDRYTTESGEILATGVQALVRLPIDQMRADRRAGLHTAAFISGYQGSPLGGYDRELQSQRALLDELRHRAPAGAQRGARRHGRDRQPGRPDLRLPPLRRRRSASGTASHPASTGPATPSATATSPARPATAACWPWPVTTRPASRRRCRRAPRRPSPRSASSSSTRARCRTSSTSACTASPCPGPAGCGPRSRSSPPSPTARAPPLVDPERIQPVVPTLEVDGRRGRRR